MLFLYHENKDQLILQLSGYKRLHRSIHVTGPPWWLTVYENEHDEIAVIEINSFKEIFRANQIFQIVQHVPHIDLDKVGDIYEIIKDR